MIVPSAVFAAALAAAAPGEAALPPTSAPASGQTTPAQAAAAAPQTPASAEAPITIVLPPVASLGQPAPAQPGDIVVSGYKDARQDPLAGVNTASFGAIQAADKAVIGPVAKGYEKGVPEPVRDGLRNFLRNLNEPVVFVNFLLQLKPGKALRTIGRFAVNSTLGVAGLVDIAKRKPFHLPWQDNGFANTLGCYGVKSGPYLFLPLVGSTSLRDLFGLGLDKAFLPTLVGKPFNRPAYAIPSGIIDSLNDRIEIDAQLEKLRKADNPYAASRSLYLRQRAETIEGLCGKRKRSSAPPAP